MTEQESDKSRLRRILRLRGAWRKPRNASAEDDPEPLPYDEKSDRRRSDALESNDRIRAEAPDDLETRRRADQLEREIKRSPGDRR
jgi:hypothetical protein